MEFQTVPDLSETTGWLDRAVKLLSFQFPVPAKVQILLDEAPIYYRLNPDSLSMGAIWSEVLKESHRQGNLSLLLDRAAQEFPLHTGMHELVQNIGPLEEDLAHLSRPPPSSSSDLLTWEQYFAPLLNDTRLFHHRWQLVGRTEILEQLHGAVTSQDCTVVLLRGKGGIGKTRLLCAFGEQLQAQSRQLQVRFLHADVSNDAVTSALEALGDQRAVLIVDDAHRMDALQTLLVKARRPNAPLTVVLSYRPWADEVIRQSIRHADFDTREVLDIGELARLSRSEIEALATQGLGQAFSHCVDLMVAVAGDSPLVLLVGCRLLQEGQIDPRLLSSHDEFRREVLDRLLEDARPLCGGDPEAGSKTLRLIAALTPYPLEDSKLLATSAEFLGQTVKQFRSYLDALLKAGVLERRSDRVRVTPDVLADHILLRAVEEGQAEGENYFWTLYQRFHQEALGPLLRNLAELDWALGQLELKSPLKRVWADLLERYDLLNVDEKTNLLYAMATPALFIPGEALQLADHAFSKAFGETAVRNGDTAGHVSQEDLRFWLPPMLKHISLYSRHTTQCCRILWRLGRDDEKGQSNGDSPIRILSELAGFDFRRDSAVQLKVVRFAGHLLKQRDAFDYPQTPLAILAECLKRAHMRHEFRSHKLQIHHEYAPPEAFREARDLALNLVRDVVLGESVIGAFLGLEIVEDALRIPRAPSHIVEMNERWMPELDRLMTMLEEASTRPCDPLIVIRIGEIAQFQVRYGEEALRPRAQHILDSLPITFPIRLTRALCIGQGAEWPLEYRPTASVEDMRDHERRRAQLVLEVAEELISTCPDPAQGLEHVIERATLLNCIGRDNGFNSLLWTLSERNPSYAFEFLERLLDRESTCLDGWIGSMMFNIRKQSPAQSIQLVRRCLEQQRDSALRSIASASFGMVEGTPPTAEELEVLERFLMAPDAALRQAVCRMVSQLAHRDAPLSKRLLLSIKVDDNQAVAHELCLWLLHSKALTLDQWEDAELQALLEKLIPVPNISDYQIITLVKNVMQRKPDLAIDMLLKRIERARTVPSWKYEALPDGDEVSQKLAGLQGRPEHLQYLRQVRDLVLSVAPESHDDVCKLFKHLSEDFCSASIQVLMEWVEGEDPKQLCGVTHLLALAKPEVLFRETRMVEALFEAAELSGTPKTQWLIDMLCWHHRHSNRERIVGEPPPAALALVRRSEEILGQSDTVASRPLFEALRRIGRQHLEEGRRSDEAWEE